MISAMGRLFVLFALADLLLLAVALIDCLSCEDYEIRALPKVAWVLVILLFSPVGGIAWFVAGRPERAGAEGPRPRRVSGGSAPAPRRPLAPDDDPEFLRELTRRIRRDDTERLRRWEEDLRRREEELRRRQSTDDTDG